MSLKLCRLLWVQNKLFTRRQTLSLVQIERFLDNDMKWTQELKLISEIFENKEGKGENAGYPEFFLFPTIFSEASPHGL